MTAISEGQYRVREIINKYLPLYEKSQNRDEQEAVFKLAKDEIALDPVITHDPITSANLGFGSYSRKYLTWLRQRSPKLEFTENLPDVSFGKYIYDYSNNDKSLKAFSGGNKWWVTLYGLFTLAQNGKMRNGNAEAVYYEGSGILIRDNGGNHRILACVLWGQPQLHVRKLVVVDDGNLYEENFHQCFLKIEAMFSLPRQFLFLPNSSLDDLERVRCFTETVTEEEFLVLKRYFEVVKGIYHYPDKNVSIDVLWLHLQKLRKIQGGSKLTTLIKKLNTLFGKVSFYTIAFEMWMERCG